MNDPTENLVRAFDIRKGDLIEAEIGYWPQRLWVHTIEPLGGDEMGPALWRFCTRTGRCVEFPYAALVKRLASVR